MKRSNPKPRFRARSAAAALLLGLAALAAPAHAQNRTELWSATMTTAEIDVAADAATGYVAKPTDTQGVFVVEGALTDDDFTHGDETYHVRMVARRHTDDTLWIEVRQTSGAADNLRVVGAQWRLRAGGRSFAIADAEHFRGGLYKWPDAPNWTTGQQIALKIRTTEPGRPKDFAAAGGEGSATLTWSAPDGPGGHPITGYRYRVKGPDAAEWGSWLDIPDSADLTEHEAVGLVAEGEYGFQLAAVNAAGPGTLFADAEASVEGLPRPPLRSDRPCAGARWCATLTVGGFFAGATEVTGYRGAGEPLPTGTATSGAFRTGGVDYAVRYLHQETTPEGDRHTLFFATDPDLPAAEKELVLDVGGRRFQLRDASRIAVPAAGGGGAPYAWNSHAAPVLIWPDDNTVSARLFAPRGVPHGSSLRPAQLEAGDRFRLLFMTQNFADDPLDGASIDAVDYNDAVRRQVLAGSHPDNPAPPHAGGFTALVGTPFVAATDNAGTTHRSSAAAGGQPAYAGVPVYWMNFDADDENFLKRKVADDYADLLDGDWDDETHPKDGWGEDPCIHPPCTGVVVSTGSLADGSADPNAPFGAYAIRAGALNHDEAQGPVATGRQVQTYDYCSNSAFQRSQCDLYGDEYFAHYNDYEDTPVLTVPQWRSQRLYGLSPVFEIRAEAPTVYHLRATTDRENEIELTWDLSDGGSPLTVLKIQRRDDDSRWADAVEFDDFAARSHLFDGVCESRTYRVVAENAVGSTASRRATGRNTGGVSGNAVPVDVEASDGLVARVEVTWKLQGCEKTIDRMVMVYPHPMMDGTLLAGTVDRAARSFVHEGLDCGVGTEYGFVIDYTDGTERRDFGTDGKDSATTAACSMQSVALTAEFVADSLPANHGGADTTFTARIQFNRDPDVTGLCDALTVTDGACESSAKVGDDAALWEVEIAPDASKPVTVALPETADCDAAGAVCTSDDSPLSAAITTTVQPPILESAWESLPDDHGGGGTTFAARVRFIEAVDVTRLCDAFEVTHGTCKSSSKVGGDAALWEITVEPDGAGDVKLELGFTTDCDAAGAVCTEHGTPLSYGLLAVVSRRALTVALVSLPADHGGVDTTFTAKLRFSEAVDVDDLCGYVSLLEDATCGGSARDAGDANLWEVVVAPEGAADVWFILPANDCGHDDAVCTADGEPLAAGVYELVPRRPFTAAWVEESVPTAHRGAGTEFTVRVRFSEDAHVSYVALRDEALEVTNGTCTRFRRVDGRNDLREATIEPDGTADVSLLLDSPTDCDAGDAVCTKDDSPLTTVLELSVPGS